MRRRGELNEKAVARRKKRREGDGAGGGGRRRTTTSDLGAECITIFRRVSGVHMIGEKEK